MTGQQLDEIARALQDTVTVKDLATELGVPYTTAAALVRRGVVPAIHIDRAIRIPRQAVQAEVQRRKNSRSKRILPLPANPHATARGKTTPNSNSGSFAPHVGAEQQGSLTDD